MMGNNDKPQDELFYSFDLNDVVPEDHLLRSIDCFLDLSDLRQHLAPYYSHTGRPSIDPELMIRMLIIGYCLGIRSERRLCEEVKLNLAYRWFCRLSIEDTVPDHSTFSKNRHGRFREAEAFRFVFEQVLSSCIDAGLVGGEGFAVDASVVKADASRQRHHEDDDDWGGGTPAIRDYLEALQTDDSPTATAPKKVSQTDPAARWTAAPGGPAFYAYSTNYLVDTDNGIIVDVEATAAHRTEEVWSTRTMIERVKDRFNLETNRLIGDTAYGTAEFLGWMVNDQGIEPHVPVWDRGGRSDGTFSRSDFIFDEATDSYTCPNGKQLRRFRRNFRKPRTGITKSNEIKYRASQFDCAACPFKERCCPNALLRKVTRSIHEAARDVARAVRKTEAYRGTRRQRKKVEMLFAHMKRILKMDRLRLRGMNGARDEFLLTATAQNLRRMAKYLSTGPPVQSVLPAT
ncbi:MAG: transposase [Gammaproteobacteria bacterium]|nr:transposase [Gammaproteobacteria bacterium]MDH3751556.1 transposase [Gammaproteobacteria bacterium]